MLFFVFFTEGYLIAKIQECIRTTVMNGLSDVDLLLCLDHFLSHDPSTIVPDSGSNMFLKCYLVFSKHGSVLI